MPDEEEKVGGGRGNARIDCCGASKKSELDALIRDLPGRLCRQSWHDCGSDPCQSSATATVTVVTVSCRSSLAQLDKLQGTAFNVATNENILSSESLHYYHICVRVRVEVLQIDIYGLGQATDPTCSVCAIVPRLVNARRTSFVELLESLGGHRGQVGWKAQVFFHHFPIISSFYPRPRTDPHRRTSTPRSAS